MAMKPDCKVAILGTCKMVKQTSSAPVEVTLSFPTPLGLNSVGRTRVMLACMPLAHGSAGTPSSAQATDGKDIACVWPTGATIKINGVGSSFAAPIAARDAPSAPLADITPLLTTASTGATSASTHYSSTSAAAVPRTSFVSVTAPRSSSAAPAFIVVVMQCTPRDISGWIEEIATKRCLKASISYGALKGRLEAKRRGAWYGLVDSERLDLSRLVRCPWMTFSMAGGAAIPPAPAISDIQTVTTYTSPHKEPEIMLLETSADVVSLQDPLTQNCLAVPVRGELCDHSQCFDLQTYLQTNLGDVALPAAKRWLCPLCGTMAVPCQLWVDTVVVGVLKALSAGQVQGSLTRSPGLQCATMQYRPVSAGPPTPLSAAAFSISATDKAGQSTLGSCNIDRHGYALPHAAVEAGVRLELNSDGGASAGSGASGATAWKLACTSTVSRLWLDQQSAALGGGYDDLDDWEGDDEAPSGARTGAAGKIAEGPAAQSRRGGMPSTPSAAAGAPASSTASNPSALAASVPRPRSVPGALGLAVGQAAAAAQLSRGPLFAGGAGSRGDTVIDLSSEVGSALHSRAVGSKSGRPVAPLPAHAGGTRPGSSSVIDLLDDPDDPAERAKRRKAAGYIPSVATFGPGR